MSDLPPPTREVTRLVTMIGPQAALALIEARGGTRFFIPSIADGIESLETVIGLEAARKLAEARGREYIKVPVGREWRVLVYRAQGLSYAEVARKTGCSENTVWRVLNAHDLTSGQLDLFQRA